MQDYRIYGKCNTPLGLPLYASDMIACEWWCFSPQSRKIHKAFNRFVAGGNPSIPSIAPTLYSVLESAHFYPLFPKKNAPIFQKALHRE